MQWLVQQPMPEWLPGCDGEALPGYKFIRGGFKLCTFTYYNGVHCHGRENFPAKGTPTILCFNHSNGLVDPMVVIRACPRMVRFVAKDTLWAMPVIGSLVASAGAVPVQRKEEHGDNADVKPMFGAVTDALEKGQCIGVAPEGNSKMRTHLDTPLKPGAALMAVEAAFRHMDEESSRSQLAIHIVPCGIVYLSREKMRSEVLLNFGQPIVVDANFLRQRGVTSESNLRDARIACVSDIVKQLSAGLAAVSLVVSPPETITCESQRLEGDWKALGNGVTAARIHQPGKKSVPLTVWTGAMKDFSRELAKPVNQALSDRVRMYQQALDALGLPDAFIDGGDGGCMLLLREIAVQAVLAYTLFTMALPGLIFWCPVIVLSCACERAIITQGVLRDKATGAVVRTRRNFDTIAEGKMTIGFVGNTIVCSSVWMAIWFSGRGLIIGFLVGWLALPVLMLVSMRLLEEASAAMRSTLAKCALIRVVAKSSGPAQLEALREHRRILTKELASLLPGGQPQTLAVVPSNLQWSGRNFFVSGPWHRWKADWHEAMSLREDLGFLNMHEHNIRSEASPGDLGSAKSLLQNSN